LSLSASSAPGHLAILPVGDVLPERCFRVQQKLGWPLLDAGDDPVASGFKGWLNLYRGSSSFQFQIEHSRPEIRLDLAGGASRHRRKYGGGRSQLIARAMGMKSGLKPSVLDLTAGFGRDAFVLASLGCRVTMVERNPLMALLLEEALMQAKLAGNDDPELAAVIDRLKLVETSAEEFLSQRHEDFDIAYLDPMFPERKKTAAVKKDMQMLQLVLDGYPALEEEIAMLSAALGAGAKRVVVKRSSGAPAMGDGQPATPGYQMEGSSCRFDVYPLVSMTEQR
jgi:16S rRNA (guanine1516-N2)-methyltransferase